MRKKSQVSTEYLILVGFLLIILFPAALLAFNLYGESESLIHIRQAQQAVNMIVNEAESIFYQGPPSMIKMNVYFPPNVDSILIHESEIIVSIKRREGIEDIAVPSNVKLSGGILSRQGNQRIKIQTDGSVVHIENVN